MVTLSTKQYLDKEISCKDCKREFSTNKNVIRYFCDQCTRINGAGREDYYEHRVSYKQREDLTMKLQDTIEMMSSDDYKERFKAEYYQLQVRIEGLGAMLAKYKAGTLSFSPVCSYELLNGQLKSMELYASFLEHRAVLEDITL